MNAPVLWGVVPFGIAFGLLWFRRWERQVNIVGAAVMLLLAGSIWIFPINQAVRFGPWSFRLGEMLEIFGRRFVIEDTERGVFALIYFLAGIWFLGALAARPGYLFVPLGMIVVVLWVGALAVEPFLYAALFLEIAVIISVPFLRPPGGGAGQGVLRYLTFQSLGMPFILFTGWMLGRFNPELVNPEQLVLPTVLVGFGFAFLLAIFPFHTWLPMLAVEAHPYAAAFIFLMLPAVVSLFGFGFLSEFSWLRNSPSVFAILRGIGFLMTLTGGVWAAFDFSSQPRYLPQKARHLGRILGYAAVRGTGLLLLTISLGGIDNVTLFFALLLSHAVGYWLWALALTYLREQHGTLDFPLLQGVGRKFPATAIALIMASFSVAGFPLLSGFPTHLLLLEQLADTDLLGAFGVVVGGLGLLIAGLRTLAILVMSADESQGDPFGETPSESRGKKILLISGTGTLLILGLFPQWLLPLIARLPQAFEGLSP